MRSESTTLSADVVDHYEIQVRRSPVTASVDQIPGIQEGQVYRQASE